MRFLTVYAELFRKLSERFILAVTISLCTIFSDFRYHRRILVQLHRILSFSGMLHTLRVVECSFDSIAKPNVLSYFFDVKVVFLVKQFTIR